MAASVLPSQKPEKGHSHKGGIKTCPLFKMLPTPLQEKSQDNEFLMDYLHTLPVDEIGIPEYYEQLDRSLGDLKSPNLIYPIKEGLYVHIYPDPEDSRDFYIAIEPGILSPPRTPLRASCPR